MASTDRRPPNHKTVRKKKTRELPNLSDCNACNRRTNSTNPSERLRILNSQWRVVLLCKSCHKLVESAKLCSYCLTDSTELQESGAHKCRKCHHQVHKACVSRYSNFAPFSYLPPAAYLGGDGFSICIDCWVPRLVDGKGNVKVGSDYSSPGISRVSDSQEKPKSAEEVANEADGLAREKALIAEAAKEKALMKAEVARDAVEFANGALDLAYPGRRREQGEEKGSDDCDLVDGNDKQLALRLHRAMNSSPRIAKHLHLSGGGCSKSSEALEINDDSSAGKLSMLGNNVNGLESQVPLETTSLNVGCKDNGANAKSQPSAGNHGMVFVSMQNGRRGPEWDGFFCKKYSRRSSSNS